MSHDYCTLFDSNYLARGLALYESLREHDPGAKLRVFCMDDGAKSILDRLDLPQLAAVGRDELESHDPELAAATHDRSQLEYCFTATPAAILASLEREPALDSITYLDADICFFSNPQPLFDELGDGSVQIAPHRYAPEHAHLESAFGIHNVEWLTFRNDDAGLEVLRWWRERCLDWCYYRVEDGKFGDQKYLDDWPTRFPAVRVLQNIGGGLAPWNVTRYRIHEHDERILVDDTPLIFYHFHSLILFSGPSLIVPWRGNQPRRITRVGPRLLVWTSAYDIAPAEEYLVWKPYLLRLSDALQRIRSVEPGFRAGFAGTRVPATRLARGVAAAAHRQFSKVTERG